MLLLLLLLLLRLRMTVQGSVAARARPATYPDDVLKPEPVSGKIRCPLPSSCQQTQGFVSENDHYQRRNAVVISLLVILTKVLPLLQATGRTTTMMTVTMSMTSKMKVLAVVVSFATRKPWVAIGEERCAVSRHCLFWE